MARCKQDAAEFRDKGRLRGPSDPLSKVSGPQYAYVLIFHMFLRFNEGKEAL